MDKTGLGAIECDPEGTHHLLGCDPCQHGLFSVDEDIDPRSDCLHLPVHIDDTVGGGKDLFHLLRHFEAAVERWPVDLCHERREHRRTGWDLRYLDVNAEGFRGGQQHLPHLVGERVRLVGALVLVNNVDLDVGQVTAGAQEVVAHQAVKVERRRGPNVNLEVDDLGHGSELVSELASGGIRLFESKSFGCVDHNLQLGFIVVRQHLDCGEANRHGSHGSDQQRGHTGQEDIAHERALDHGIHDP